jgi:hypothetical protein
MTARILPASPMLIHTARNHAAPLSPPRHWFGSEHDYRSLMRARFRADPQFARNLSRIAHNYARLNGPELTQFRGPYAGWAEHLVSDIARHLRAKQRRTH